VNTLRLGYKNQEVNDVYRNDRSWNILLHRLCTSSRVRSQCFAIIKDTLNQTSDIYIYTYIYVVPIQVTFQARSWRTAFPVRPKRVGFSHIFKISCGDRPCPRNLLRVFFTFLKDYIFIILEYETVDKVYEIDDFKCDTLSSWSYINPVDFENHTKMKLYSVGQT
jgi:hypothetical protein